MEDLGTSDPLQRALQIGTSSGLLDFSVSSIISGIFFGIFGMWLIKRGRKLAHPPWTIIGFALCVFPYFVPGGAWDWVVGFALLGAAYYWRA